MNLQNNITNRQPKYSIAIIHLNMAETVARCLTSILEQLNHEFEVIVVDDGSTDGSVPILEELEEQYEILRVETDAGNKNHGEARRHATELANGEYVLSSLDADDEFTPCITQFVSLYHEVEDMKDNRFCLLGYSIYMAPRSLLLDIPYRSMGYGEDRDIYRRLLAHEALIGLSHHRIRRSNGYHPTKIQKVKTGIETIANQFRSGIHLVPYLRWAFEEMVGERDRISARRGLLHLLTAPIAYLISLRGNRYDTPEKYQDIGRYKDELMDAHMTLKQIEERFNIDVDREAIGPRGCAVFDIDEERDFID